jgi:hypothetical protein
MALFPLISLAAIIHMDSPMDLDANRAWKTTLISQARVRSPLLWAALFVLLLPLLACAGVWSVAAQPGPSHGLKLALMSGRTLEIDVRPCSSAEPGRMTIWYIDATRTNRFLRERFMLLWRSVLAPSCPPAGQPSAVSSQQPEPAVLLSANWLLLAGYWSVVER